ncbi:MAG: transporter, partial [Thermodesulfovibrionales bacterium]|nr:transporter [Thermodesulfovibrionales bacterium]
MRKEKGMFNGLKVQEFRGLLLKDLRLFLVFVFSLFAIHFSLSNVSFAAHPLITDDTGTQGKGKFQVEINSEFFREKEKIDGISFKETGGEIATVLSYGLADNVDIVLGVPYQWFKVKEDGITIEKESGISDVSVEFKWRFFEQESLSFAIKPGFTLPTGDDKKGLGAGKATYSLYLIVTKEIEPFAFHLNAGYIR